MSTRILLLSGVRHAHDYLALMASMPGIELVGVAEAEDAPHWAREDGAVLASTVGLPFLGVDEGLAASDAVVVCSEPGRHAALAIRALRAGRHVLVDKPAATSARQFEGLAAVAAEHPELIVTSVHRLRSPAIVRARRAIDDGGIGLPLSVDAEWIASGGLDGTTVERPELVCDPALSGGGELTNFGLYPILALRHFTGLEVVEVMAMAGTLFGGPHARYGVEDSAVLSLLLERGVTATITVARVPAGVSHEPISSTFRILGSHGYLNVDETEPTMRLRGVSDAVPTRRTIGGSAGLAALRGCFGNFVDAIHGRATVALDLPDIARALRILDAARSSIESGSPVSLR
jgi:myo-inositol 2-dehydrogenase/D-chiro-inositol 1-dehydrogenase